MPYKDPVKAKECAARYTSSHREEIRARQRATYASDPDKERLRSREKYQRLRERKLARGRERYRENRENVLAYHKAYRESHPDARARAKAKWAKANRGTAGAIWARYNAAKLRAMPEWADKHAIRVFYQESVRLTRETGTRHEVDHIVPLQSEMVCGLHVPWNLQILTRSENAAKSNKLIAEAA